VCENGYGKRTPFGSNEAAAAAELEEAAEPEAPAEDVEEPTEGEAVRSAMQYRLQRRGGKGVRDIRTTERNGPVVGIAAVRDSDDIMLITTAGMVNRTHVREIRVVGRNTQGVRVMGLNEGDKIATIAKVAREEDAPEASPVAEPPPVDGQPPA
jgi:DNA gyrase subunit A